MDPELPNGGATGPFVVAGAPGDSKGLDELAKRVADLEKALKKADEKAAADKKKAASKPTFVLGGRMYLDTVFFGQSDTSRTALGVLNGSAAAGDGQDSVYFRALRLEGKGEMFDVFSYKLEVDFSGREDLTTSQGTVSPSFVEQVNFKDIYLRVKELPLLGNLSVGHYKEPFSLEELISSKFTTFMERALPVSTFVPARNAGVMAQNMLESERATWAIGVFRDDPNENLFYEYDDNGGWAVTARATWLPWYDEATEGRGLLHTGLAYRYLDFDTSGARFRARPETGVGPRVVDTGNIAGAADMSQLCPEVAFVYGPFSLQGEWIGAMVHRRAPHADAEFGGMYVLVSYFLTGEHRPYKRSEGRFVRIRPFENFFRVRDCDGCVRTGRGAWELAYRYSNVDLNDIEASVFGGTADDHTIGVNWYLNPYSRVMFNYVHSNADFIRPATLAGTAYDAATDVFEMRAQFDF